MLLGEDEQCRACKTLSHGGGICIDGKPKKYTRHAMHSHCFILLCNRDAARSSSRASFLNLPQRR